MKHLKSGVNVLGVKWTEKDGGIWEDGCNTIYGDYNDYFAKEWFNKLIQSKDALLSECDCKTRTLKIGLDMHVHALLFKIEICAIEHPFKKIIEITWDCVNGWRQYIGWLVDCDDCKAEAQPMQHKNILEEANSLVHGDRQKAYGPPLDDFTRTAAMANAVFAHLLQKDKHFKAEDVELFMCLVKLSREINAPKRDNMADLAGYAQTRATLYETSGD